MPDGIANPIRHGRHGKEEVMMKQVCVKVCLAMEILLTGQGLVKACLT